MLGDPSFSRSNETAPVPAPAVTVRHLLPMFLWASAFLIFFFFIGAWKLCLMGLLAALCLSAILRPLLFRLPGPRGLKGFLLGLVPLVVCVGLVFLAVWMLVGEIRQQFHDVPQLIAHFNAWLAEVSQHFGLRQPITVSSLFARAKIMFGGGMLQGFSRDLIDIGIGCVFVFIGTIYLLAEPSEQVITSLLDLFPARRRLQARGAIADLEPRLRWWLIGALVTATIIGLTSLLGFWLIGIKLWIPLAILAGISEFVPTIGPLMAFLLALAVAATQGPTKVAWLCGLYVFVHILESYILIPLIYKEAVRVPPIVTLFTIVLWGEIFGIGGLLLALPINLVLWTMAEHFIGAKSEVLLNEHGEAIAPHVEIKR